MLTARRIGRFLIRPHELLQVKNFVAACCALVIFEEILLIYSISLSAVRGRCFRDESIILKSPYWLLVVLVSFQMGFYFLHLISAIFFRFKDQNLAYQNRTRLALCTRGLSEAQKRRIHKTNFSMDIVMFCWTTFIFINFSVYMFYQAATCNYLEKESDSYQSTSCMRCESVVSMFFFSALAGMIINFLSKVSLVSSEIDFTVQSQRIEAFLACSSSKSSLVRWYQNAEARHASAVPYICGAVLGMVAVFACWFLSDNRLPAGFTWNINVLARSTWAMLAVCFLLSCTDGSILRMIDRMRHILVYDRLARRRQMATRGIFSWPGLTSLPRRKFVFALLSWSVMPLFAGFITAANGALGKMYYFAIETLIFNTLVFVIPMFLVRDRRMSINDLLDFSSGDDNYGLVLSRQHLVKALRDALETFKAASFKKGTEPIKVNIPSFLASQARVELSVAVSYRWTDEYLYKKKDNRSSTWERDSELIESDAPIVLYLSNHLCLGFDWNVKLTISQVNMLVDGLSDAPEDYVWMDQFCIPQKNNTGSVKEKKDFMEHELKKSSVEEKKDFMEHELKKSSVRGKLVSRMTGLYACAGRVLVLNNSGDDKLLEIDWYQYRLWCLQEYGFAWNLTVASLSDEYTKQVLDRRDLFQKRWFGSSHTRRHSRGKVDHADDSSEIILDWMHISDKENLKAMINARVRSTDCHQYMGLVSQLSASDSNDTFSALAQPWFGIVMTSEESRKILAQAITAKSLSEPGVEDFNVIINMNADKQFALCRGSMRTERMLSCYLGGLESGEASVHVRRYLLTIEACYKISDEQLTGYYAML
jgi:hypothetical protein